MLSLQIKFLSLDKQQVIFKDLGIIDYKSAWDYQEELVKANPEIKAEAREAVSHESTVYRQQKANCHGPWTRGLSTVNYLLFCEHPPVYTLGKSGEYEKCFT